VINLAARAGVRYSVDNPWVYVATNVIGTLNMLELVQTKRDKEIYLCLHLQHLRSESSVSDTGIRVE